MKAYDRGFRDGASGAKQVYGRAYETDKANKAYYQGFADGLRSVNPGKMIVRCNRDATIFAAPVSDSVVCPACYRRYTLEEDGKYRSDRELTVIHKGE